MSTKAATKEQRIQAILNLACVVLGGSWAVTPAMRERAETMLEALVVEEEVMMEFAPHSWPPTITGTSQDDKSWYQLAREACPNWRDL